jgi:hypothetical protein
MADKSGPAGRRTRTKTTDPPGHPYQEYEGSPLWKVVDQAVGDLVNNGDVEEKTHRSYIVGYICKLVSAGGA